MNFLLNNSIVIRPQRLFHHLTWDMHALSVHWIKLLFIACPHYVNLFFRFPLTVCIFLLAYIVTESWWNVSRKNTQHATTLGVNLRRKILWFIERLLMKLWKFYALYLHLLIIHNTILCNLCVFLIECFLFFFFLLRNEEEKIDEWKFIKETYLETMIMVWTIYLRTWQKKIWKYFGSSNSCNVKFLMLFLTASMLFPPFHFQSSWHF